MLYDYCHDHGVPHKLLSKLIVTTSTFQVLVLENLLREGIENGSPFTGIINSHSLMIALWGDAEEHGTSFAFNTSIVGGHTSENGIELHIFETKDMHTFVCNPHVPAQIILIPNIVINSTGLSSPSPLRRFHGFPSQSIPKAYHARGIPLAGENALRRFDDMSRKQIIKNSRLCLDHNLSKEVYKLVCSSFLRMNVTGQKVVMDMFIQIQAKEKLASWARAEAIGKYARAFLTANMRTNFRHSSTNPTHSFKSLPTGRRLTSLNLASDKSKEKILSSNCVIKRIRLLGLSLRILVGGKTVVVEPSNHRVELVNSNQVPPVEDQLQRKKSNVQMVKKRRFLKRSWGLPRDKGRNEKPRAKKALDHTFSYLSKAIVKKGIHAPSLLCSFLVL
eukprot:Gb_33260 [translate_table: standard]